MDAVLDETTGKYDGKYKERFYAGGEHLANLLKLELQETLQLPITLRITKTSELSESDYKIEPIMERR